MESGGSQASVGGVDHDACDSLDHILHGVSTLVSEPPALNVPTFTATLTLRHHDRTSCAVHIVKHKDGRIASL